MQRKSAAAALSQAGRAGPDEPTCAIPAARPATHAARRPDVRDRRRQTDRQTSDAHHRLIPPPRGGHNNRGLSAN